MGNSRNLRKNGFLPTNLIIMRLNLQTKLLALVVILIILASAFLVIVTTAQQKEIFQSSFKERGIILAQTLEAGIASKEELTDLKKLQSSIYKLIWLNPEIVRIDMGVVVSDGLQIVASNDTQAIKTTSDSENNLSFEQGMIITRILSLPDTPSVLSVITPIHVGGQRVGTYDIRLSLETEEASIREHQKQLILLILATVVFISISLSLFLRRIVVIPVLEIQKGSEKIRAGNLDWRIILKNRDELGDLAKGFNKMAEKLKELYESLERRVRQRTKELENTKAELEKSKMVLEIKVKARTRELEELTAGLEEKVQQRTKELEQELKKLEKFQRITVGRELKMIELKKEIKKLKIKEVNPRSE